MTRRISLITAFAVVVQLFKDGTGQLFQGETVEGACPNAFLYENPVCVNNGTLHIGDRFVGEKSCSYCDCPEGWGGVDCGRCYSVSTCPDIDINGTIVPATNCSANSLIPTDEESKLENGKIFSCSCGGGGDAFTEALCGLQEHTWVEFTIKGPGTQDSPAVMTFTEFAGIETKLEEAFPGEQDFYYPVIFEGTATQCTVTRGNCLPVEDTNLGREECVRYDCQDTQGSCPPPGYPVCDGFPNCVADNGRDYQVHTCVGAPAANKALTIACQENQAADGTYVCWYQQPGEFAPLSMTCSVGSCLYEEVNEVQVDTVGVVKAPLDVAQQSGLLVAGGVALLLLFLLFAVATDWGSASNESKSCCFSEKPRTIGGGGKGLEEAGGSSAEGGTLSGAAAAAVETRAAPRTSVVGGAEAEGGSGQGAAAAATGAGVVAAAAAAGAAPYCGAAVLEWKNLCYSVAVNETRTSGGCAGGGLVGFLARGCRYPELSVLSRVSGFAGPMARNTARATAVVPPGTIGAVLLGRSPSISSNLSAALEAKQSRPQSLSTLAATPAAGAIVGTDSSLSAEKPVAADAAAAGSMPSGTRPSTITGILGPSGAGKSTLLDILAGRKRSGEGRATGHVWFSVEGGVDGPGSGRVNGPEEIRRVAGYVPQEDVLPGTLTCYEHLMFHARLRMPRSATHAERRARALLVLGELGLSRVADSRVGDARKRGLSGGEKRRLSIAAELMSRPPLLFADEPTTGLDAATALRVMTLLKGVASRGTTIVCSIHQPRPRVLNLLDNVMLLAGGQVAYFGPPGESESYFTSVGRPFPAEQPHPADAMLTLCCRADGGALPALFERCALVENGVYGGAMTAVAAMADPFGVVGSAHGGSTDGLGSGTGSGLTSRQSLRQDGSVLRGLAAGVGKDIEAQEATRVVVGPEQMFDANDGNGEEEEGAGWRERLRCLGGGVRGGAAAKRPPTAGFFVQTEALSRRLLLRAVRHPLLLVLHFGGSVAMAVCLGTIFQGKLDFSLGGAQSRLGALFFLLLYLSLLSLTSLPVWREDRQLFLSESMGGAYGHLPYFLSVALADVLLVRVVPPLAFAVVAYPLMGLNDFSDGKWTLLWFALILVLANVSVALAAMGVGALGLPLDLSNLLGGAMVLIFSIFSRFLLNGSRIPKAWDWLSNVTPLGYAYESLLVNEFNDPLGQRPYTIDGGQCSPELPIIKPLGSTILKTFEFNPSLEKMYNNVGSLALIALVFGALSFLLFYIFTRTSPLRLRKPESARICNTSRPASSHNGNPIHASGGNGNQEVDHNSLHALHAPVKVAAAEEEEEEQEEEEEEKQGGDSATGDQTPKWGSPDDRPPTAIAVAAEAAEGVATAAARSPPPALLLSWEDVSFTVPKPGRRWCAQKLISNFSRGVAATSAERLVVLSGVSGFAGPTAVAAHVEGAASGKKREASPAVGTVTAIMGPSGAGKTTLLNILAGRNNLGGGRGNGEVTGTVRINGQAVVGSQVRGVSGYVMQEDVLPETLTCFEHLMFHAELRMSSSSGGGPGDTSGRFTREDRRNRVLEVLRDLRLEDVCNSRIGGGLSRGISGGEKRRLSIATELLTCPGLLFLDEPTTGLDSSTALTTMQLLSSVAAARGTTVLCSLHQPRPQVYDSLDRVLLVSRGEVSFFGPPSETAVFFASIGRPLGGGDDGEGSAGAEEAGFGVGGAAGAGLADAMLDVIGDAEMEVDGDERGDGQGQEGTAAAAAQLVVMPRAQLLAKVRSAESEAPPPLGRKMRVWTPPITTQLRALSGRALRDVARDPYLATLHVVLTPLVGLLVGSLFGDLRRDNDNTAGIQGRLGALYFFLLVLSFLCLTSLASWVRQMALFRHERESGAYGALSHLTTSFLADAAVCRVLPPVLLAVVVRPLAGLRYGSLGGLCGALVVFNVGIAAVLAACGAGARSPQEALALGCLFVLFSALLSGYLVARDDLPAVWEALVWASPFAHGFEALVINEFSAYSDVFRLSTVISGFTAYSPYLTGDNILSCFGFESDRYEEDLGLMAIIGGVGLLLAYALLKRA